MKKKKSTTVNEEFEMLQRCYFEKEDKKALEQMYNIICLLAKKYIKAYARKKGCCIRGVSDKAHDVAAIVIERKFCRKKGARIKKISTYIYFDCLHEIVREAKHEQFRRSEAWQWCDIPVAGKAAGNY